MKNLNKISLRILLLGVALLCLAVYACRKDIGLTESEKVSQPKDLLASAKAWYAQQSSLPSLNIEAEYINLKDFQPNWSAVAYSKNNKQQTILGVPLYSSGSDFLELNVVIQNGYTFGIIKYFKYISDTQAELKLFGASGQLISSGNYDLKNKTFIKNKLSPTQSSLYMKMMSEDIEGGELEEVTVTETAPGGGSGGGGGTPPSIPPSPVTGGGGGSTSEPTYTVPAAPIYNAITDLNQYLNCFSKYSPAKVTIYADQPKPYSRDAWVLKSNLDIDVGHSFISIEQGSIIRYLGFYPKDDITPNHISSPNKWINDSGHYYDVKYSIYVSLTQFTNVMNVINSYNTTYHLDNNNCTTFALAVGNAAGGNIPSTYGTWAISHHGNDPGDLGQDLRSKLGAETTGGTAGSNYGSCGQ